MLFSSDRVKRVPLERWTLQGILMVAPLLGWLVYLDFLELSPSAGGRNFAWPLSAYIQKWISTVADLRIGGWSSHAPLSLWALIALTTQALALALRRDGQNAWWRLGIAYAGLLLVLGPAVWEGHPGAETRVLLPLTVAFNILLPRGRAFWPLLVLGNLTVIAGLEILQVPVVWRHV